MTDTPGLMRDAQALADHSQALNHARRELRDHPEWVQPVLKHISDTLQYLDDVLDTASAAYSAHAGTAVTVFGDETRGSESAVYTGGILKAATHSLRGLRDLLLQATAESDRLIWPQHDPVAAEQLHDYYRLLQQRAERIEPDQGAPSSPAPPSRRSDIGHT